jgi:transcriptional antiterminator Rof (Rho-off)
VNVNGQPQVVSVMTTERLYIPISCNIHDHIEIEALKRTIGPIKFMKDSELITVHDRISTWEVKGGVEYLITRGGLRIRFDDLKEVFGVPV